MQSTQEVKSCCALTVFICQFSSVVLWLKLPKIILGEMPATKERKE